MSTRPILIIPDTKLRTISEPVASLDSETRKLVEDMFDTMYDAPGIGLAAIQVGVQKRVITIDLAREGEEKNPIALINPEILSTSQETSFYNEGCLSIPEFYEEVERPARVALRFTDLEGAVREVEADGLFATCVQHEIDHLNGVLFIDHISKLKRDRVVKKFTKMARREGAA
ncbi:peptide deformylase [Xanthobacter sp. TB0136]|uniref:peptide deformylase n=1 Tax=Xanthobacter sp. TB0136 TaxID=3459177 RepID=UPI00403974C6